MLIKSFKTLFIVLAFNIYSTSSGAAIYKITFYESLSTGTNLFTDYQISGTATFEINDTAIGPNNLVLFSSPEFLAFDAVLNTTAGNAQFILGIDDFPPKGDGTLLNDLEQGILFDASGQPLRFDTPATTYGNGAQICNPDCDIPINQKTSLVLLDNNSFQDVFLTDGTITTLEFATNNGLDYTRLGGDWSLRGTTLAIGGADGVYQLQTVPVPAAMWLFGSGLIGLIGIARRKK